MMGYRLLALDLDDTILGPDRRVGRRAREVIRRAQCRDVTVVLATGRPYSSARLFARRLGITGPVVANSGSVIRDSCGRVLRELNLEAALCRDALDFAAARGLPAYLYTPDAVYCSVAHPAAERYSRILEVPIEVDEDLVQALDCRGLAVTAMGIRVDVDRASELESSFRCRVGRGASVLRSVPTLIEILPPGTSKGDALHYVAAHLGIPIHRCVAVGDSTGDLDMLEAAGRGVLVANAEHHLHERADLVTDGSFIEGVAEVVERFFPAGQNAPGCPAR